MRHRKPGAITRAVQSVVGLAGTVAHNARAGWEQAKREAEERVRERAEERERKRLLDEERD